ncbi:hypothetical protein KKH46_03860 [Patescibacteria group bacterium]|nr:hypothetical protein [Patescibacteria group bacterium]MBU1730668.1 hypothetical protein [Patescibacteria group bacterium]
MKKEKGQIWVVVALFMLVLIILFSLVADVGKVYLWQKKLEMAVDAAALAGGQEYALKFNSINAQDLAQDQAEAVAVFYAGLNGADTNNVIVAFTDELNDINTGTDGLDETLQVDATMEVPLMFTKMLGILTKELSASAGVRIGSLAGMVGEGPAPWGPPPLYYQPGQRYMLKRGQGSGTKVGTGPSNYCALALPGSTGANDYRDNIIPGPPGFTGTLKVFDLIETEPGNMVGPTDQGVTGRLAMGADVVIVPIMDIRQNGRYQSPIYRFEAFRLDGDSLDKNQVVEVDGIMQKVGNGGVTAVYLENYVTSKGIMGGLCPSTVCRIKVIQLVR